MSLRIFGKGKIPISTSHSTTSCNNPRINIRNHTKHLNIKSTEFITIHPLPLRGGRFSYMLIKNSRIREIRDDYSATSICFEHVIIKKSCLPKIVEQISWCGGAPSCRYTRIQNCATYFFLFDLAKENFCVSAFRILFE